MIQTYISFSIVCIFIADYAMHPDRRFGPFAFLMRKETSPDLLVRPREIESQLLQVHYT